MVKTVWTPASMEILRLQIQKVEAFPGGTYQQLPSEVVKRGTIINISNQSIPDGSRCFLWSVLAHFLEIC